MTKRYLAVVHGRPPDELRLDSPIGRDPIHRTKISSRAPRAKSALSLAQTLERLPGSTLLSVRIETGRTHQIRVHLSEAGYPLVGDRDYGGGRARGRLPVTVSGLLQGFPRPALHASRLGFIHPTSGERVEIEAPLPADLESLLSQLRTLGKSP